jgi:hypothetical protein
MTPSGIEPAPFSFVAQFHNQLRHGVHLIKRNIFLKKIIERKSMF